MLSALVLVWGTMPLGVRHAHAGGGDSGHRHDACHEAAHHASHDHDCDGHHHDATVPDVSVLTDFILHLHWEWLGMDFSMPVPGEPTSGDDDGETVPPAIVRVMDEIVPAARAGPSLDRVLLSALSARSPDVVCQSTPIPSSASYTTSIPLCDAARLERSGVLLV